MATRARIGIQQNKRIIASYQHWDGYPGGLGYNLCDNWENPKKVTEAIKLGDASKWGAIVGNKIDFDNRQDPLYEVQNVYYGRDRGEKDVGFKVYKDEADYIANGFKSGEQFVYLMKDVGEKDFLGRGCGTWFYSESIYTENGKYTEGPFKPLEIDAVKDHINILKRSYKLGEVA